MYLPSVIQADHHFYCIGISVKLEGGLHREETKPPSPEIQYTELTGFYQVVPIQYDHPNTQKQDTKIDTMRYTACFFPVYHY